MEILDTHQHLWDLARFQPPWLPASGPLAGVHGMAEYVREIEGTGITQALYMEVDVRPEDHDAEVAFAVAASRRSGAPTIGAVIGGRPGEPAFAAYLRKHAKDSRVRAVRQVLHGAGTPQGFCLQDQFVRSVQLMGELGLAFDICVPSAFLDDAEKLAKRCPATRLVLDHCGNANVQAKDHSQWKRDIERISAHRNVWCKISGIVATAKPGAWDSEDLAPFVTHCSDAFGDERVVFGSDWPVCTTVASIRQWVGALKEIISHWPDGRKRKLLRENAVKAYGLTAEMLRKV